LTRSERAVAELVTEGLTNREIGARLFISPHTVNSHLRRAFEKLGVSTRAGLAAAVAADVTRRTTL
jgi:DNA-binding CsgD family transcriptional regulator